MRIVIIDRVDGEAVAMLRGVGFDVVEAIGVTGADLSAALANAQALVIRGSGRVTRAVVDGAPELLVIGRAGVGCDNIDLDACGELGIAVLNTPGASAITTAERTIALMLALLHQIPAGDRSIRAGKWERRAFKGNEVYGKTLGILGYGNIGRVVAERARGLHMRVIAHDPNIAPDMMYNLGIEPVSFDEIFRRADIVTCHVSSDPALTGLLGAAQFDAMRPGSWLINASRGFLVDEAALVEALRSKRLAGAALDVFAEEPLPASSPLRTFDNVVLSPHLGASTAEAEYRVSLSIAHQLISFLREGKVSNPVLLPAHPRHRIAVRS